jgi:hypothetical protein
MSWRNTATKNMYETEPPRLVSKVNCWVLKLEVANAVLLSKTVHLCLWVGKSTDRVQHARDALLGQA